MTDAPHLKRQLKARHLWAIAVGMVISGQYFGWNYGLTSSGLTGMILAAAIVSLFYLCFMFSYAELATSIPQAGGPSAYAHRAMGRFAGFIAGVACLIEFVFAPPAIAVASGYYIHFLWHVIPTTLAAVVCFSACLIINSTGTKDVARFEMIITVLALVGLVIYYLAGSYFLLHHPAAPHHLQFPKHYHTIDRAIPFAIWLYLAIEGIAMSAEETVNPKKTITKGIISAIITLACCSALTILFTAFLNHHFNKLADYPLSFTLAHTFGKHSLVAQSVSLLGLCGLLASLNGIMIGYSRQTFALARDGYLPKRLAIVTQNGTPIVALILPGIIGLAACIFAKLAGNLIILSAFGAVTMYCIALLSLFVLRYRQPQLERPFKVWFPIIPVIGLILGILCWLSILRYALIPHHLLNIILIILAMSLGYYCYRSIKVKHALNS